MASPKREHHRQRTAKYGRRPRGKPSKPDMERGARMWDNLFRHLRPTVSVSTQWPRPHEKRRIRLRYNLGRR